MTTVEVKANVQKEKIISLADEDTVPNRYYIEAAHTYFPLMQFLSRTMIENGRAESVDDLMTAIISGHNKSLLVRIQAPFVEDDTSPTSRNKTTGFVENPEDVQITHKVYELTSDSIRQEMEKQKARYLKRAMNR